MDGLRWVGKGNITALLRALKALGLVDISLNVDGMTNPLSLFEKLRRPAPSDELLISVMKDYEEGRPIRVIRVSTDVRKKKYVLPAARSIVPEYLFDIFKKVTERGEGTVLIKDVFARVVGRLVLPPTQGYEEFWIKAAKAATDAFIAREDWKQFVEL